MRRWFPTHLEHIVAFLRIPTKELDVGLSLQLQKLALAMGEMAAIEWLCKSCVQEFLEEFVIRASLSSLAVERKNAEYKRWEQCRLLHVATASRNGLLRGFARQRLQQSQAYTNAERELQRLSQTNVQSMAFAEAPPEGMRLTSDSAIPKRHCSTTTVPKKARRTSSDANAAHRALYLRMQGPKLQSELSDARQKAALRLEALEAAQWHPVSRAQWQSWMLENIGTFRERMKTAPGQRRVFSKRLIARDNLPKPAPRLQPQPEPRQKPIADWSNLLYARSGWVLIQTPDAKNLIFLVHHRWRTHYVDICSCSVPGGQFHYRIKVNFNIKDHLKPLEDLENKFCDDVVSAVWKAQIEGRNLKL